MSSISCPGMNISQAVRPKKKKKKTATVLQIGVGNGNAVQYSCLENSMERGAWQAQSVGSQRVRHDWATEHTHMSLKHTRSVFKFPSSFFFFLLFFGHAVRPHWVLVPQPGIKPTPHALEAQSLNHWTTWEAPSPVSFYSLLTLSAQLLNIQCISKCDQNFLSLLLKVPNSATDVPKG